MEQIYTIPINEAFEKSMEDGDELIFNTACPTAGGNSAGKIPYPDGAVLFI